ncbi:MAG: putative transcriptional regulator, family [Ferruginibacter sp.]|nr:putative transcriptional regulator, family [Ferruginibacter sp.]
MGVGLRFIRELEQGKTTLKMDKVNQVLELFGYQLRPGKELDPYTIYRSHVNRPVKIYLRDKRLLFGIILRAIRENNEIKAWDFVSNNNAIAYEQKGKGLITVILSE